MRPLNLNFFLKVCILDFLWQPPILKKVKKIRRGRGNCNTLAKMLREIETEETIDPLPLVAFQLGVQAPWLCLCNAAPDYIVAECYIRFIFLRLLCCVAIIIP